MPALAYDPSTAACEGDATLIECRGCGSVHDVEEVCPCGDAVPYAIEDDEPTERLERETNEDVVTWRRR